MLTDLFTIENPQLRYSTPSMSALYLDSAIQIFGNSPVLGARVRYVEFSFLRFVSENW